MTDNEPHLERRKRDWPRALRALQELLNDASQTQKAFIVIDALDGGAVEAGLRRMLREHSATEDSFRRVFETVELLLTPHES